MIRFPFLAPSLLVLAFIPPSIAWGKAYDKQANEIGGKLKPLGFSAKADPNGLKQVAAQVSGVLTLLEKDAATNGPGTHALLKTAYEKFRTDVGPAHRTAAITSLEAMWNEARGLGAFDENHAFTGKITRGTDGGKDVVFEYISPLSIAPQFSKDVANVRLTSPSRARVADAAPTQRETAYQKTLDAIAREMEGMKSLAKIGAKTQTDAAGLTKEEAAKRFKEEVARNGDAANELPTIILKGMMVSTPSKRTGGKWLVEAELTNLSPHATEVELQTTVLGTTHKSRENYLMQDTKQKLQLRGTQVLRVVVETLPEGIYKGRDIIYENLDKKEAAKCQVNYRGTIWRVIHAKGQAAVFATENSLLDMLKKDAKRPLDGMAKLFLDPKDWAKATTTK